MRLFFPLLVLIAAPACSQTSQDSSGNAQTSRPDLFVCDGCERAEARDPDSLDWRSHLPPEGEPGERLAVSGRVVQPDGTTPAQGIVLYFHQTNAEGLYRSSTSTGNGGPADGMIEGWLVTDEAGRYEITTVKPGPYPGLNAPAHIHIYVKEPERRPYYIDDITFEGDPLLDPEAQELRGGSGIVRLAPDGEGGWTAQRDIVLER